MRILYRPDRAWRGTLLALVLATLVLGVVLTGCGADHARQPGTAPSTAIQSTSGSGTTQGTSTSTNASASGQSAQDADSQAQDALHALDAAQNDATTDYSSQDNGAQP